MRAKKIAFSLALLTITLSGFIHSHITPTYVDLNQPIYLIIDKSFWSGCEYEPENEALCGEDRIKEINAGIDDWFKHFDKATRPKTVIIYSEADLPFGMINTPVYIRIKTGFCQLTTRMNTAVACYQDSSWSSPTITFDLPKDITSGNFSHELGHALGREHDDMLPGQFSVMTYEKGRGSGYVVPIDIKILCDIHAECPPHDATWCEGTFYDSCRCPSESFEASQEENRVCE